MTITQRLYAIGCMLFLWYACLVLVPQLSFLIGLQIAPWQFWASLLLFTGISWLFHRNYFALPKKRYFLFNLIFTLLIFGLCLLFAQSIIDTTFEGTWFHLDAVHSLKNGWSPTYRQLSEEETSLYPKYLNHFPKLAWIYGATIFSAGNIVELGKAANLQLMLGSLFIAQHLGRSIFKLSVFLSWIIAILIASNPVQLLNLCSFSIDGQVASLLFIGIAFSVYQVMEGGWFKGFLALLAFGLLANLKFTAAFYSIIYVSAFLGFLWYTKAYRLQKLVLIGSLWLVFTFGFLGWSPYLNNLSLKGNLYNTLPDNTENVFSKKVNYPINFSDKNRFERFFCSFYAEPKFIKNAESTELKRMFSQVSLETYQLGMPDLAGFGPFAPEVFSILLPLALWVLIQLPSKQKGNALFFLGVIIFSIFINPEAWVLRYVPQFWIFIVFLLLIVIKEVKWQGPAFVLAMGLLLSNIEIANEYLLANYSTTQELKAQVSMVKDSNGALEYYSGKSKSIQYRLEDMGLPQNKQSMIEATDSTAKPFTGGLGALFRKRYP